MTSRKLAHWAPWVIVLLLAVPALPGTAVSAVSLAPPAFGGHSHLPQPAGLAHLLSGPVLPQSHTSFQVDPFAYYSSEPAPMGIADFGVDPATSAGYIYNTTMFVGTVNISSLTVLNGSNFGAIDQMSLQLNVVQVVSGAGGTFEYWIQDVAFLNTTSNLIEFIDNIWNMSASGAYTTGNDITGNGTGAYGWYYDYASNYLSGNNIYLSYPTTFQLRVVSSIVGGYPSVAFEYNDTGSWETYDNTRVAFAHGYSDQGFVVDGTNYNPYGLFNDAELILGGPGGGSQTTDSGSNLGLTLDYWNGHNMQPVLNAYNFGSDTAEGINHVVDRGFQVASDGLLYGDVKKGGTAGLMSLYDHSYDALVNVSAPLASGVILLNGTSVATYIGGDANLTIAPGTYTLQLDTLSGSVYASQTIVVPPGAYLPVVFGAAGSYSVTFKETGLPTGTPWSVTIGANLSKSAGTVINLLERNGTYGYVVSPLSGWTASPWSGNFTVAGQSVTVGIAWTRVTYPVNFTETGLPNGTLWQVVVGGAGINGRTATLEISEPNGTYTFLVDGIAGYVATPSGGSVTVSAAGRSIAIAWGVARFNLTFVAQGLPTGTTWTVQVDGLDHAVFTSTLRIPVPNGTYPFQVGLVPGFVASPSSGSVPISGLPVTINITFTLFRVAVTFTETGLPAGANWSVSVAGLSGSSTGTAIVLEMINGTYDASVVVLAPYTVTVSNLSFSVHGSPVGVLVPFAPLPGWLAGTVVPTDAIVTVNGTTLTLSNGAFNVTLPIGNYTLVASLSGYQTVTRTISIGAGAGTILTLNLTMLSSDHGGNGTQPVRALTTGGMSDWELLLVLAAVGVAAVAVVAYAVSRRRQASVPPPEEDPAE